MLKNKFLITLIIAVVSWVAIGVFIFLNMEAHKKEILAKDEKILQLQTDLDNIGQLVPVYLLASDVKMGKAIQETDVITAYAPVGISQNFVTDLISLTSGSYYYKTDLTQGTPLTVDDVYEDPITDDLRYLDVVVNNVPIGLKENSYVDIRISFPMGEDFIGLSHKKVHAINGGVLKLAVTSKDIHTYNSMLLDYLIYSGTTIYAIEYVEGGAQKAADTYYPVSANILAIAQKDPNLLEAIKADMLQRREGVDDTLSQFIDPSIQTTESLEAILTRGRERYSSIITDATREYLRVEEARKLLEQQQAAMQ